MGHGFPPATFKPFRKNLRISCFIKWAISELALYIWCNLIRMALIAAFARPDEYRTFIWLARRAPLSLYDNRSVFTMHGTPGRCTSPTTTRSIDPSLAKRSLRRCPWCQQRSYSTVLRSNAFGRIALKPTRPRRVYRQKTSTRRRVGTQYSLPPYCFAPIRIVQWAVLKSP